MKRRKSLMLVFPLIIFVVMGHPLLARGEKEEIEQEIEVEAGEEMLLAEMLTVLEEFGLDENDLAKIDNIQTANLELNKYYKKLGSHKYLNELLLHYSKRTNSWTDKELEAFFEDQGWRDMLTDYIGPQEVGDLYGGYKWEPGMGEEFVGDLSGIPYKDLYVDYLPLPDGPVLNPNKTYKIGYTNLGLAHPWLLANAENALWEASKHPNIEFELLDGEFDESKMATHIDNWIAQDYDGIMIWPATQEALVSAVNRAHAAAIELVDMDRKVNSPHITHVSMGNAPQNGLQNGLYVVWKTKAQGGNVVLSRKAMGATTDATRTGRFIEVLGSFIGYDVVASYHTDSNAVKSYNAVKDALQANQVDIIFATGDEEGKGALRAVLEANRMDSGKYGKIIMVLSDDSREILYEIKQGNLDECSPLTPLSGALGLRALIKQIGYKEGLVDEKLPKIIMQPNLPMITKEKEIIFGIETLTPNEWPYAYGPLVE